MVNAVPKHKNFFAVYDNYETLTSENGPQFNDYKIRKMSKIKFHKFIINSYSISIKELQYIDISITHQMAKEISAKT